MAVFLILLVIVVLAYLILRRFAGGIFASGLEMLAVAAPLSFAVFAAATSMLAIYLSTYLAAGLTLLVMAGLAVYSFLWLRKKNLVYWIADTAPRKDKIFYFCLFFLISGLIFFLVYDSFIFRRDGSISMAGGAAVDDPYHLSQVTRIGYSGRLDFEEPNFSGEFIRYPYFINLVSGVLLKVTRSIGPSFNFPVFFLAAAGVFLLILFFRELGLGKFLTAISLLVSLFGGGLGYLGYLWMEGFVPLPIRNGVLWPAQNISYPGIIPGFLIVQRPFFLGLPLFLLSLIFFIRGLKNNSRRSLIFSGTIAGLLPFSHTHSFIALSLVIGSALVYLLISFWSLFFEAVRGFVFPSALLALPQLAALLLLPKYPVGPVVRFRIGWMGALDVGGLVLPWAGAPTFVPRLLYIWTNFGFLLFLPVFTILYFVLNFKNVKNNLFLAVMIIGSAALWIIPNIVQFQVWDFDTNKFFAYAVILSAAAVGIIIESWPAWWKKISIIIFSVIVILSIPSSIIANWRIIRQGHFLGSDSRRVIIWTLEEQQAAGWLRKNVSENAVILSSAAILDKRTIQNPVVTAAGLKSSAGFMTWLYTHGIDYAERVYLIEEFFKNPGQNQEFFEKAPADYLIVDPFLREKYPELEKHLLENGFKKIYRSGPIAIFSLKR